MDRKNTIDALPYIDRHLLQNVNKTTIDELISKEMKSIDKEKINDDINNKYPTRKSKTKATEQITMKISPLADTIQPPTTKKFYDESEWEKLFKEQSYTIEAKQIENLNLELLNKNTTVVWDNYIDQTSGLLKQLKDERDKLKNDILFLNKKRKYDQMIYQGEINTLDNKIGKMLSEIDSIEKELMIK